MFSNINEAYEDNPLGQQLKKFENDRYKQSLINSISKEQRIYNNYNDESVDQYSDPYTNDHQSYTNTNQSFITTQGNVEPINKQGTRISDLRRDKDDSSLGSILDDSLFSSEEASIESSISNDTIVPYKKSHSMKDRTHEYYIRNFIKDFGDNDSSSLTKHEYEDTYDHIKTCKYCKDEIKLRMNGNDIKAPPLKQTLDIPRTNPEKYSKPNKYYDQGNKIKAYLSENSDIKEIVVVVLIGIVIIFLLDLFAKISKTLGKK